MNSKRKKIASFIFTTAIISTSAVIGHGIAAPLAGTVMTKVGASVASVATAEAIGSVGGATWGAEVGSEISKKFLKLFRRVLTDSKKENLANPELYHLRKALEWAFEEAINDLEQSWWENHPCGKKVRIKAEGGVSRYQKIHEPIKYLFQDFKRDAAHFCAENNVAFFFRRTDQLIQIEEFVSQHGFINLFDSYCNDLPDMAFDERKELIQFINQDLCIHFKTRAIERITTDDRAWRAWQLLVHGKTLSQLSSIQKQIYEYKNLLEQTREEQTSSGSFRGKPSLENQLHNALLKLDYREQIISFRRLNKQHANAFLIHGPPMFGQRWLLNRLVRIATQDEERIFHFDLRRRGRQVDIRALWREMYNKIGLHDRPSITTVLNTISDLWQRQTVILIFHGIDLMSEAYLKEFLRKFWAPLRKCKPRLGSFKLLMLLVDYSDGVKKWNIRFDEAHRTIGKPHFLVKLPVIQSFNDSILTDWAINYDFLPVDLTDKRTALEIINKSENGTPELVMQHICTKIMKCSWSAGVEQCLAH